MSVLFVLLPQGRDLDELLGEGPGVLAAASEATLRRYPQASDSKHAFSLVRDGRDRFATRWIRGVVLAMAGGAVLGAVVNAVLSIGFGMFSGLSSIAIPLGFVLGAFLGAFTAAMTGTHCARQDLLPLLGEVQAGDVLLQWHASDRSVLQVMRSHCGEANITCALLD
ncbi:MAG: hypothetical protein ACI89X_000479 [Planctomycetota bacterium]|jgi:hypothetical protein